MNLKRALTTALAVSLLSTAIFAAAPPRAQAAAVYGRAITSDVGFYKDDEATELLFYIPYTYYVRITEKGAAVSHAEIFNLSSATPAIDGYVYTDKLYFENDEPIAPFYEQTLTTSSTAGFYSDCACSDLTRYIFENRKLKYYGYSLDSVGGYVYFVEYNGALGYVKEESVQPFSFVPHPTPLPVIEPEPDPTVDPETPPHSNGISYGLKIAVIVLIALAAVVVIIVMFRPERKLPAEPPRYFDENDYE